GQVTTFRYTRPKLPPDQILVPSPIPKQLQKQQKISLLVGLAALCGTVLLFGFLCYKPLGIFGALNTVAFGTWWLVLRITSGYGAEKRRRSEALRLARNTVRREEANWAQVVAGHNQDYRTELDAMSRSLTAGLTEIERAEADWRNQVAEYR